MALFTHGAAGWTPVAHADSASALANSSYQALRSANAADLHRIVEVFIGGEATSSTVNRMALRRITTNANTPTNQTPAALHYASQATLAQGYVAASTGPTIAATQHLLNLAFNSFGGLIRWVAAPGEEIYFGTATQPNAECVLDSVSGTGIVSTDIKFESY